MSQLSAYRVPPLCERKAAQELREAGIKAYLPRDRNDKRRPPVARGYVFSAYKPAFAKHVRSKVGPCTAAEVLRLYPKLAKAPRIDNPYKAGDTAIRGEIEVRVASVSGRVCRIEWTMLGKTHTQSIHYSQLRPG